MALYDGTGNRLSGYAIGNMLIARFWANEFPPLSDILGSDWNTLHAVTPRAYRKLAWERAAAIYDGSIEAVRIGND